MFRHGSEVKRMAQDGYALAAVIDDVRVYRGMGEVITRGPEASTSTAEKIAKFTDLIHELEGHIGFQGSRGARGRPRRNGSQPDTGN